MPFKAPLASWCELPTEKRLRTAHVNFPILINWQILFNCGFFCTRYTPLCPPIEKQQYKQQATTTGAHKLSAGTCTWVVSRWNEQWVTAHKLIFFKSSSLKMVKDISPFDTWTPAKLSACGSWHATMTHRQCQHSGKKAWGCLSRMARFWIWHVLGLYQSSTMCRN